MSDNSPLITSVLFILVLGLVLPFLLSFVVDTSSIEISPLVTPLVSIIEFDFGFEILTFELNLNPFHWLGDDFNEYLSNSVKFLSFFPDFVLIIILIVVSISIITTIIKLFPTT